MNSFFKKALIFTLVVGIAFVMSACGNRQDESNMSEESHIQDRETSSETDSVSVENQNNEEESQMEDIQWDYAYDFSEGLAWIDFKTGKKEGEINSYENYYMGVINKNGEMVFRIKHEPTDSINVTKYSNGYAFVTHQDRMDVIDTTGEVVSTQSISDTKVIRAYGDGYILSEEHFADFDSNGYVYKIYSPEGEVMKTIETADYSNFVRYLGKGVFLCNGTMYFLTSGQELNVGTESDFHDMYFYEDNAAFGIDYYDPDIDGYRGKVKFLDLNGQIEEVELYPEYGWNWDDSVLAVKNGVCIIYSYKSTLITYNLTDKSFTVMPEDIANKVVWDDIRSPLVFDDSGRIALTLQGSDGNYYIALFDSNWNMVTEPVQVRSNNNFVRGFGYSDSGYVLSNGQLIVSNLGISEDPTTYVYDNNGKLMYELYEKGFYGISPYSNDVACVSKWDGRYRDQGYSVHLDGDGFMELEDGEIPQYLDLDGNLLFERIDMSKTIER